MSNWYDLKRYNVPLEQSPARMCADCQAFAATTHDRYCKGCREAFDRNSAHDADNK